MTKDRDLRTTVRPFPAALAAAAILMAASQPALADPAQDALIALVRKQSAQIEQLQADLQQLRQRVDGQGAASPVATVAPPSAATTAAAVRPQAATSAQVASADNGDAPILVAPAAAYTGLVPDLQLGRATVKFRGDVVSEIGYTSQTNDANLTASAARERFRLIVNPDVAAGGGVNYGGLVRYVVAKGDQSVNAPDRAYVYANGPAGQFSAGVRNGFGDDSYFPWALDYLPTGRFDTALGFMVPNGGVTGGSQATSAISGRYQGADIGGGLIGALNGTSLVWPALNVDNSATKLMYTSPRVSGVRFGIDWTPRNDAFNISTNRVDYTTSTTLTGTGFDAVFRNLVEIGADYDHRFGDVRVLGDFVYNVGKSVPTVTTANSYSDLSAFQAGVRGEIGGFALGASALYFGKSAQQINSTSAAPVYRANTYSYSLESQYKVGRWVVGGVYRYGQDPGQMNLPGVRTLKLYELGFGYTLWDGLQLQFSYDHFLSDSDKPTTATSGSPDDKGDVATARAVFRF
jgi:outer membrane protein OmpU